MTQPAPLGGKLMTRPFVFLSLLVLIAAALLLVRFVYGLHEVTNLNNGYPWGLWVVLDIHFTAAIGCGGYVLAVLVYVLNKGEFHPLMRPALLGSTFAYTLASLAAFIDIGRWWNFYQIALPWNINLNSVMFEIAICMALYTLILWIEIAPALLERFGKQHWFKPVERVMFFVIALGIVLPTMHQSGLGALVIAAGTKIYPLWQTPWIGFLFLMTAIIIGFSIVVFEGAISALGFRRPLELHLFAGLFRMLRWVLVFYLAARFADLAYRDALGAITADPLRGTMFWIEIALYVIPLLLLWLPGPRKDARALFFAATCLVLAGAVLRFNALIVGFLPPPGYTYFPSVSEMLVSIGMLSLEAVGFIYIVKRFPIFPAEEKAPTRGPEAGASTGPVLSAG